MAAAPLAIAGLAISAAGTAASIAAQASQGGGSSGDKSAAASLDQLNYLEKQQQKKNALTTEMIETAKQFANQQYDQEIVYLQNARAMQQEQLQQQAIIAEQNYTETQRGLQDQQAFGMITDATTDFQKNLQLSQANMSRDLAGLQRESQYGLNEQGRRLQDSQADLQLGNTQNQAELGRAEGEAGFGMAEQGRGLSKATDEQQLAMGREEAMLAYMRGKDQLATDNQLLNIQQSGAEQTNAYQRMSQDLQMYQELTGINQQREQGRRLASNDKKLSGNMSVSDIRANLLSSGVDQLRQAQDAATLSNHFSKGSLNNQLDINLAEIQTKRLGLQQTASSLNTQLKLDEVNRTQQKAQADAQRGLASLQDRISMLVLPEAGRQLGLMQAGQQNAATKMGTQLGRAGEQNQVTQGALTDEYSRGVDQTNYNIDQKLTGLDRVARDSNIQGAQSQNQAQYQQALLDLIYGNQSTDKSYQLGVDTAEQGRQTTMQSRDIDQLQQIALQKASLSNALSQVGAGLFQGGGGGGSGLEAAIGGVGNLFKQGMGVMNSMQGGQKNSSPYQFMAGSNVGSFGQSTYAPTPFQPAQASYTGNTAQLPSFGGR